MALIKGKEREDAMMMDSIVGKAPVCFLCGKPIDESMGFKDLVVWSGGSKIFLHPDCACELGQHLIKDGLMARL